MARYKDLNLDFTRHPMTNDVATLTDMEALKRSVRNIVLTSKYDRPFKPEMDAGVRKYLFEVSTPLTALRIKNSIELAIKNFEPRVELLNVTVRSNPDRNSYDVSISGD